MTNSELKSVPSPGHVCPVSSIPTVNRSQLLTPDAHLFTLQHQNLFNCSQVSLINVTDPRTQSLQSVVAGASVED